MSDRGLRQDKRMELYKAGLNDVEIARIEGRTKASIHGWRKRLRLPPNCPHGSRVTDDQQAARRLLYDLGWSDYHIAAELKRHVVTIHVWRRSNNLPPNFIGGLRECDASTRPTMADLVAKCRRSVARWLPRDIAEDAVADLMVDVMTGKLAIDKIGDAAKKYGNRVVAAFANKWGARSLDAEIGDSDGFTLLDTIADDSASSWLEEMGATVW